MYEMVLSLLKNNLILCRIEWTAVFTACLFIVAWWQLGKINKTSSADFLHRFKIDFFNDKTRLLIVLIEYDCLKYLKPIEDGIPYFEISLDSIKDTKTKDETRKKLEEIMNAISIIDAYEIDDLLLGHFEDMGILRKKKILEIEMIYEAFSSYIEICWENEAIKQYIKGERERKKEENWDLYDNFDDIYRDCNKFKRKKKIRKKIIQGIKSIWSFKSKK
jgi:hypothetical protein